MPTAPGHEMDLVTRGDDVGGSAGANRAVEQCFRAGILLNASVMAVGPALEDAAARLARLDGLCVGVHVTLNSEFTHPRFRPLLPADRVPTLVGEDGCFLASPAELNERGMSCHEALAEVSAQLRRLRALGFRVRYLDEHMGVGWVANLADGLRRLASEEGLLLARDLADPLPHSPDATPRDASSASVDRVEQWLSRLRRADPARPHVLITHPTIDDEETKSIHGPLHPPGTLSRDRDRDRLALLDPRLRDGLRDLGVRCVRYVDLADPGMTP